MLNKLFTNNPASQPYHTWNATEGAWRTAGSSGGGNTRAHFYVIYYIHRIIFPAQNDRLVRSDKLRLRRFPRCCRSIDRFMCISTKHRFSFSLFTRLRRQCTLHNCMFAGDDPSSTLMLFNLQQVIESSCRQASTTYANWMADKVVDPQHNTHAQTHIHIVYINILGKCVILTCITSTSSYTARSSHVPHTLDACMCVLFTILSRKLALTSRSQWIGVCVCVWVVVLVVCVCLCLDALQSKNMRSADDDDDDDGGGIWSTSSFHTCTYILYLCICRVHQACARVRALIWLSITVS